RNHHRCVGLVDGVGDGGAGDVVVVGGAGKAPGIAAVRSRVGVRGVAHIHRADRCTALAVHAGDRSDGGAVRLAVVSDGIRGDHHRCVGLVDGVGDGSAGDVVVVGGAGETPGIAAVRSRGGVRGVAHIHRADRGTALAAHAGDRSDGGAVRLAVVSDGIRRDHHRCVGLVDGVGDGSAVDVVVVGGAGK